MKTNATAYQPVVALALASALVFVAVVILRTERSPADLMALAVDALIIVGAIVYAVTNRHNAAYRWAVGLALAATFVLFWMVGAVALLGPEIGRNIADLIYFGVPTVGVLGAIVAGFRPHGMAWTMSAAAVRRDGSARDPRRRVDSSQSQRRRRAVSVRALALPFAFRGPVPRIGLAVSEVRARSGRAWAQS